MVITEVGIVFFGQRIVDSVIREVDRMTIDRVSWDSFWVRRVALGGPSASEGMIYVS